MYGVGERLAGVGEFGFAVMSICTHRVLSSQPAFSIGAPPGFEVKHVTTGASPSEMAATDCCAGAPVGAVLAQEPLVERGPTSRRRT